MKIRGRMIGRLPAGITLVLRVSRGFGIGANAGKWLLKVHYSVANYHALTCGGELPSLSLHPQRGGCLVDNQSVVVGHSRRPDDRRLAYMHININPQRWDSSKIRGFYCHRNPIQTLVQEVMNGARQPRFPEKLRRPNLGISQRARESPLLQSHKRGTAVWLVHEYVQGSRNRTPLLPRKRSRMQIRRMSLSVQKSTPYSPPFHTLVTSVNIDRLWRAPIIT